LNCRRLLFEIFVLIAPCATDFATGQTTVRVSVSSAGTEANNDLFLTAISADGRFVVFFGTASNLVPGDTNNVRDVFVRDREGGITERDSIDSTGVEGNADSYSISISPNGRFVVFYSAASNLVQGDTNGVSDVFVHDRETGTTERVSVDSTGNQGNAASFGGPISADGRFVAFASEASNLVPGDTYGVSDVFVKDRATGATERVSVDSAGAQGTDRVEGPVCLSADGRFVAFAGYSALVPGDENNNVDAFVHDRVTHLTERVSVDSAGVGGNFRSYASSISADGRFVTLDSYATNLVSGDTNGASDIFVHDRATGATERVSVDSAGNQGTLSSEGGRISDDGRLVAFTSFAPFVPRDDNPSPDAFVHDRINGITEIVSVSSTGAQPSGFCVTSTVSADGRFLAFDSAASNLVLDDTNTSFDVFVRDLRDFGVCSAGTVNAGAGPIANVLSVNGSHGDGHRIVSVATNATIEVSLEASPSGPGGPGNPIARYVLWIWPSHPSLPLDFSADGAVVGCTVNPTPLNASANPQARWYLASRGMPSSIIRGVRRAHGPDRAPWVVTRSHGFPTPIVLTLQGVLRDDGASNPTGYSTTNMVIVQVQ
jgi:hypothetical protein